MFYGIWGKGVLGMFSTERRLMKASDDFKSIISTIDRTVHIKQIWSAEMVLKVKKLYWEILALYKGKVRNADNWTYMDDDIFFHSLRMAYHVKNYCQNMGYTKEFREKLISVALFHDIGKVFFHKDLFIKKELDEKDWELIKKHPYEGYQVISSVSNMPIGEFILCHHERWDGKGYPNNISGDNIPLESRIISVIDAYDAMVSERLYRRAFSQRYAVCELKKNSGTQFDKDIVYKFFSTLEIKNNKGSSKTEIAFA